MKQQANNTLRQKFPMKKRVDPKGNEDPWQDIAGYGLLGMEG